MSATPAYKWRLEGVISELENAHAEAQGEMEAQLPVFAYTTLQRAVETAIKRLTEYITTEELD